MSFNDIEISNQDGFSVALYELIWGNTIWRYTSADQDIDILDDDDEVVATYTAVTCWDDGMTQGGSSSNDMTVHVPATLEIVALFNGTPPALPIELTVRRMHPGEPEMPIFWTGTVGNVKKQPGGAEALIIGRSLLASFKRTGLRLCWTRGCPYFVYDGDCRKDPEVMKVVAEITAVDAVSITVDAVDGNEIGWFDGGVVRWIVNDDGTLDYRGIERSLTDKQFVIFGSTERLEVGMSVDLLPGCDLTPETCDDKFDNLPNHGGYKFMAGKSPFDGTPVF